jgi:hypothetical protein
MPVIVTAWGSRGVALTMGISMPIQASVIAIVMLWHGWMRIPGMNRQSLGCLRTKQQAAKLHEVTRRGSGRVGLEDRTSVERTPQFSRLPPAHVQGPSQRHHQFALGTMNARLYTKGNLMLHASFSAAAKSQEDEQNHASRSLREGVGRILIGTYCLPRFCLLDVKSINTHSERCDLCPLQSFLSPELA